jgi:hypothetical protein
VRRPILILIALVLASACAGPRTAPESATQAAAAQRFDAFVEQDGKRQPFKGVVHLKPAPFSFVFRSDPTFVYSVGATLDPHKLRNKTTDDLKAVFGLGNAVAERPHDTYLAVNANQPMSYDFMRMHYWGGERRFKSVSVDAAGVATSVKEIDTLFLSTQPGFGFVETPFEKFTGEKVFVLVVGRPPFPGPGKAQGFFDPKYAALVFDQP